MRVETYSDLYCLDVVRLIKEFHEEAVSEYDGALTEEAVIETVQKVEPSNCFLLIVDNSCQGLLYGVRLRSPVNGGEIFQEVMWYVSKPYRSRGLKLLNEVESILKSQGVRVMIMAVLENSKTEKLKAFYERLGYRVMETHFVRNL